MDQVAPSVKLKLVRNQALILSHLISGAVTDTGAETTVATGTAAGAKKRRQGRMETKLLIKEQIHQTHLKFVDFSITGISTLNTQINSRRMRGEWRSISFISAKF